MEHPKNEHATACPYQQVVNHSGPDKRFDAIALPGRQKILTA